LPRALTTQGNRKAEKTDGMGSDLDIMVAGTTFPLNWGDKK
jgi:hypothetical protein